MITWIFDSRKHRALQPIKMGGKAAKQEVGPYLLITVMDLHPSWWTDSRPHPKGPHFTKEFVMIAEDMLFLVLRSGHVTISCSVIVNDVTI